MLKKTMAVVFAIAIAMAAGSAGAQCTLGVYADANGSGSVLEPTAGEPFHVYVVLFTENVISAVSYGLDIPGQGTDVFVQSKVFGPTGDGFSITTSNGENVALGECAVGFGGAPILVADYTLIMSPTASAQELNVVANPDEDPNFPVINDCNSVLSTCEGSVSLQLTEPVATDATSFGAVKSLYNN